MNKDLILRVADAIENRPDSEFGFNMETYFSHDTADQWGHHCDTVACIAGWTVASELGFSALANDDAGGKVSDKAKELMGITYEDSQKLFMGGDWPLGKISEAMAVDTLRELAETGQVVWPDYERRAF